MKNGGALVADTLVSLGVERMFGVPGGQTLPIYDRIYELAPKIRHIGTRDERAAAYMADGYARAKFSLGVCDATVGPGTTNLISGVAEAYYAGSPLLVISSDVDTVKSGRGVSQEMDQLSLLRPVTKWGVRIERVDRIEDTIRTAVNIALTGRPGPVSIIMPVDVLSKDAKDSARSSTKKAIYPLIRLRPDVQLIRTAAQLLLAAERPVIFAGGGVIWSQAWNELVDLAEMLSTPVATTLTGKGTIPENHPLALGVSGSLTRPSALKIIRDADVVLAIGTRLGDIATAGWTAPDPRSKIIHIDINPEILGKNYQSAVEMVADAKLALQDLSSEIQSLAKSIKHNQDWAKASKEIVDRWRELAHSTMYELKDPTRPEFVISSLRQIMEKDDPLIADASFSTTWCGVYFDALSQGRIFSAPRGGAGIGGGFPLALGFQAALPERRVYCVAGDGGFSVGCQELETARRIELPVVVVVLNNSSLGYIRHEQKAFFKERFLSTTFENVDFAKIAEGFGCIGLRVNKASELRSALEQAKQSRQPTVIDILTDPWAQPPVMEFIDKNWNNELTQLGKISK
jgi:acetolactate synthase-1/2/3 large subunit